MKKENIIELFRRFQQANPHPKTELRYGNHYQLLTAVILSAQATDKGVNRATAPLFKVIKKPQDLLDMGEEKLMAAISSIGLFRSKGKHLMQTAKILVEQHNGRVPKSREALEALPGVGRKTANVLLNTAFGQPTMAVDTHIFRVSQRLGLARGTTPLAIEQKLIKVIPQEFMMNAHHWLILHGRYTCTAQRPKCETCLVVDLCGYGAKHV
ncbi:MAG: endonuclease III [Ferrovum sp. 37-45-19]|jgi:endonuclease-3|nr:MAG: endonuclease III [Ferrovum sp. 21-44-67]OYV94136.1 MAG: endonuclease III [Ferrovum sp. 37-45-19]OZB34312.1 MAG: endonuclease III [Ferrovum sp. 34-44-207]HQT81402.1 endonuclease III [Ferrovaceae bacterium]HQU06289.1 endonuclease III [Ferrovaceae bacterium]